MPIDVYHNFAALAARERPGADYRIIACPRPSPVAVIAPHGGGMEPGPSELARSLKSTGNEVLHITSTRSDEPAYFLTPQAA